MNAQDPKTRWRDFQATPQPPSLRIAIGASMTAEPVIPYLGAHLLGKNIAPDIHVAPFGQIHRLCLNPADVLGAYEADVIALLWRVEDMFPDALARAEKDPAALPDLIGEVRALAQAVLQLRARFAGTIIAALPPTPCAIGFDARDVACNAVAAAAHNAVRAAWLEEIQGIEHLRLIDIQGLLERRGTLAAHDARKWYLYRQPYAEAFWQDIGLQLGRIVAAEKISAKKCVVLDLDNTLWGGVIGEDGISGIALGQEFPGRAYQDFQKYMLGLKDKGVLLAVASKNNPADALEVFDTHDAMALHRQDFAAMEIHWDSKVDSIRRIAQKLNIGLDSIVFIDDSAKEIGEVQERLPAVTCVMVPEEITELPALLAATDMFDMPEITAEDRGRTAMMAAEDARKTVQDTVLDEADFRRALELKIAVFHAQKTHLARITQLVNKSNQFNLTTRRRTLAEIEALCADENAVVLGMDVRDKYGEYGLVGVCILRKDGDICDIDTLLMSCRVLGRGVEETFIAQIAHAACAMGCASLRGKYVPTAKNDMVKDLYKRFGFSYDAAQDVWRILAADVPPVPAHISASLALAGHAA